MDSALVSRTAAAAEITLLILVASVAVLLPPLNERVVDVPVLVVGLGVTIAASLALHLVFVGRLAQALGRSPLAWPLVALLTLPVGSIVGLVLLEWQLRHGGPAAVVRAG
jgi:hypothetical protein